MDIGFEFIPEHYTGDFPFITIHRKMSQKDLAFQLASVIEDAINKWLSEKIWPRM
jgi:hypothetical protein